MVHTRLALLVPVSLLAACAGTGAHDGSDTAPGYTEIPNPRFEAIARTDAGKDRDRRAILAMQGDYAVDFHFEETVALAPGYEPRTAKNSGGFETVLVVEDTPDRIVLQHLLVMGGQVIKHWRQDWLYETPERFEFVADQTWAPRRLAPERIDGHWTQCVFEVSDAPRYCGTGRWNHRYGVSTWTGDRSWRPLPRREYTVRDDYNAINAENRHTVTPHGWTHEQDNTKTRRDGTRTDATLVREFGFNDYRSIAGYDFGPARDYWDRTADYWARVRAAWQKRLQAGALKLTTDVDGMPIIEGTFAHAEDLENLSPDEQVSAIDALLSEWTETVPAPAALSQR
ncbi:MAG: DUF6607 family protein [Pseudomonadota bacterium]